MDSSSGIRPNEFGNKAPHRPMNGQDASKTPRTCLFFFGICFSMPFLIDFWLILHPNLPPKTYQNWSKIDQKSMPRGTPSWTPFFDRFLIDFWSIFRPPEPQKSLKFYWFYKYFCKIGLSKLAWSDLGAIMPSCFLQKSIKNTSKLVLGRHQFV